MDSNVKDFLQDAIVLSYCNDTESKIFKLVEGILSQSGGKKITNTEVIAYWLGKTVKAGTKIFI